jgi:hypothetical protein
LVQNGLYLPFDAIDISAFILMNFVLQI